MKQSLALLAGMALGFQVTGAEVTPDELLQAVDRLSPAQAQQFSQSLEAKTWEPVPKAIFHRLALTLGFGVGQMADLDLGGTDVSNRGLDNDTVGEFELGLSWWLGRPEWRLGLRMGSYGSEDSGMDDAGYASAELMGSYSEIVLGYQFQRTPTWILWADLGLGGASAELETLNTPAAGGTTLRRYDGDYNLLDLRAGAAWRMNPVLALFATGGYRLASETDLEQADTATGPELDASGPFGQIGLAANL